MKRDFTVFTWWNKKSIYNCLNSYQDGLFCQCLPPAPVKVISWEHQHFSQQSECHILPLVELEKSWIKTTIFSCITKNLNNNLEEIKTLTKILDTHVHYFWHFLTYYWLIMINYWLITGGKGDTQAGAIVWTKTVLTS